MKILILLILTIFLLGACVTCSPCPKTDVMTWIETPLGILPGIIDKGQLGPEGKDEWWIEVTPGTDPRVQPVPEDNL